MITFEMFYWCRWKHWQKRMVIFYILQIGYFYIAYCMFLTRSPWLSVLLLNTSNNKQSL